MCNIGSNLERAIDALNAGASVSTVDPKQLEAAWNLWCDLRLRVSQTPENESFQVALASVTAREASAVSLAVYIRNLLLKKAIEALRVDVNLRQTLFFEVAAKLPLDGADLANSELLLQRFRKALEAVISS